MNPSLLPTHPVRIVASREGLHGLSDPYGDLSRLFLLEWSRHGKISRHWLDNFFLKAGTLALMCRGDRIVAKALLQCDVKKDGTVFGHIGHFSSHENIPRWQLALIHALVGHAKGTVSHLAIARNHRFNQYMIKSDFRVPVLSAMKSVVTAVT